MYWTRQLGMAVPNKPTNKPTKSNTAGNIFVQDHALNLQHFKTRMKEYEAKEVMQLEGLVITAIYIKIFYKFNEFQWNWHI